MIEEVEELFPFHFLPSNLVHFSPQIGHLTSSGINFTNFYDSY